MKTGPLQRYGRTLAPEFDLAFQKSLALGLFPIPMPALFLLEATAGINTAAAGSAARLNSRRFNGGLRRILGVSEQSGKRPVTTLSGIPARVRTATQIARRPSRRLRAGRALGAALGMIMHWRTL